MPLAAVHRVVGLEARAAFLARLDVVGGLEAEAGGAGDVADELIDELGFDDAGLAALARGSFEASRAPAELKATADREIDAWLALPSS